MRIAIEGCCHGELDAIYKAVEEKGPADLLIICGDFQAIRNLADLQCIAVPAKFRQLGDFHAYYSGTKIAPILTIFIGGNHEASNYMQELPYGGWVAKNIYYLGLSNVVKYGGLRIGGLSGIWGGRDYVRGYMERPPYDKNTLRSVYHTRQFEVKKLCEVTEKVDIFISHDWPRGIEKHGDTKALLKLKPFFREDVTKGELGSPASDEILRALKPRHWFSAHLHVRYEASFEHKSSKRSRPENPEEISLSLSDDEDDLEAYKRRVIAEHSLDQLVEKTQFLALDKCVPKQQFRQFLEVKDFEQSGPLELEYDAEWLAITKAFDSFRSTGAVQKKLPDLTENLKDAKKWIDAQNIEMKIPRNFVQTSPPQDSTITEMSKLELFQNLQTRQFRDLLQI